MILDRQFYINYGACVDGYKAVLELGLLDKELTEVEQSLRLNNFVEYADWLLTIKSNEKYVRENGSIFTMGAYQVFNPLTGQHARYETEDEAKLALIEVAKQVLQQHCPTVVQELSNENGDTTWIPTAMNETLTIS
jgi:transposase-like protein